MRSSSGPDSRAWYSIAQRGPRRHMPAPGPPPQRHERVAFFPTGKWRISYAFPEPESLPEPKTLGERLLRCRLERGLLRADAARQMRVCVEALRAWEHGRTPPDRVWPAMVAFIGFDPSPPPRSPGEHLKAARRSAGLTIKEVAKAVGCDRGTVANWERDLSQPSSAHVAGLAAILPCFGRWSASIPSGRKQSQSNRS
jgi:transcriptional regulator with XRE-family HTH domain